MNDADALIREIEAYCRRTGTAESTFGRQAVNDGKFVTRLREGRGVTLKTLNRVRAFMAQGGGATGQTHPPPAHGGTGSPAPAPEARPARASTRPFRFYDNRQKYLAFVNTCNEKAAIAERAGRELQHLHPVPPALRVFDAGMGDATVLVQLLREMHHRFPTAPFVVTAKEISLEDVRLGLEKLPDRFCEHPATVLVVTNLHYAEAPRLMPGDLSAAAALNWHEVELEGSSAHEYAEQIRSLEPLLTEGWQTRPSPATGNPLYVRPSVLVLYREDHRFLLDPVLPRPGRTEGRYDLILASQPWRARMPADFKAHRVLAPLARSLAAGGRLLAVQSYGEDPGLELVQSIWPEESPFQVRRHELLRALKEQLGRDAHDYNFNAFSDAKSLLRYSMHTLPTEIGESIGSSTLFAAWNAAIYVNQIEDDKLEQAIADGSWLSPTRAILRRYGGLWFNDETFVVSRRRD